MDLIAKLLPGVALLLLLAGAVQYLKAMQKKGRGTGHRFESRRALMSPRGVEVYPCAGRGLGRQFPRYLEGAAGGHRAAGKGE